MQDILPLATTLTIPGNPQTAGTPAGNQDMSGEANDLDCGAQRLARLRVGRHADAWPGRAKRTTF